MKFKTIGLGLLASTALVTAAEARLSAGLYNIGNIQELCLHSDGTWDSPTYSNWGGTWLYNTPPFFIFEKGADLSESAEQGYRLRTKPCAALLASCDNRPPHLTRSPADACTWVLLRAPFCLSAPRTSSARF